MSGIWAKVKSADSPRAPSFVFCQSATMAEDLRRMASSSSSQTMDMDDDDDDDPVIRTLPVYYTPHYLSTLTLLQYPDRLPRPDTLHPLLPPSMRPDPDDEGDAPPRVQLTARYKPVSQHLEVDIPVEKHHSRYNRDRAQTMAGGVIKPITTEDLKEEETKAKKRGRKPKVEPKAPVDEEDDEPKELEWMTYSSTSVPDVTNYLVGVVKDGERPPSCLVAIAELTLDVTPRRAAPVSRNADVSNAALIKLPRQPHHPRASEKARSESQRRLGPRVRRRHLGRRN